MVRASRDRRSEGRVAGQPRGKRVRGSQRASEFAVGFGRFAYKTPFQIQMPTLTKPDRPGSTIPATAKRATKRFCLILVKPSHYDDDGYVIQWFRSTIPSNSLAAVFGL